MKRKLVALVVALVLVATPIAVMLESAHALSESVFVDCTGGGGYVQQSLENVYSNFTLTVDISHVYSTSNYTANTGGQNDYCQITLSNDSSLDYQIQWLTSDNYGSDGYYTQQLQVSTPSETSIVSFNTTTFAPTLTWDGSTLKWYGNGTKVLIASINTQQLLSGFSASYIESLMAFDAGNVTISIGNFISTPTPTPSPTPSPSPSPSPTPNPTPTAIPTPTPTATASPSPSTTPLSSDTPTPTTSSTPNPKASPTTSPTPILSSTPPDSPAPSPSPTVPELTPLFSLLTLAIITCSFIIARKKLNMRF